MMKVKQEGIHGTPDFINILSTEDKTNYKKLQEDVGSTKYRYNRNHRYSTLNQIFDKIHEYCECNETDKWKRYLVCGICWFGDYLAINTRQLRFLISKSKSTINDALLKMEYLTVSTKGEPGSLLLENIPYLFGNQNEFRKWSIRKINKNITNTTNKIIKIENNCVTENDDIYIDDINFLDDLFKNNELNKNETDNKFAFVNFDDNVDEYFDFGFGFDDNNYYLSSCCDCSASENDEIIMNNHKFEESTRVF